MKKEKVNYEKEVKKAYPAAMRVGVGFNDGPPMYHMIIGCTLGENYFDSREKAWENAYKLLILKSKKKNGIS